MMDWFTWPCILIFAGVVAIASVWLMTKEPVTRYVTFEVGNVVRIYTCEAASDEEARRACRLAHPGCKVLNVLRDSS